MKREVTVACPGAGKTTYITNRTIQALNDKDVLFLTFTRAAADEAISRIKKAYPGLTTKDIRKYVRTLNSWGNEFVGLKTSHLMRLNDYNQILAKIGYARMAYLGNTYVPGARTNCSSSQRILSAHDYWRLTNGKYLSGVEPHEVSAFDEELHKYKLREGKVDFFDQLKLAKEKLKEYVPKYDCIFVDECNDLGDYHWSIIDILKDSAKEYYVVGDDDQAIYDFAGADPTRFIAYGDEGFDINYLTKSHRVPQIILDRAVPLLDSVKNRYEKNIVASPRNAKGKIRSTTYYGVQDHILSKGSWLVLGRTRHIVWKMEAKLKPMFDRKGITNVKFMTIHQSKGREADNVIVSPEFSRTVLLNYDIETESRLFYVAMTRAKKKLIILHTDPTREFVI